MKRTIGKAIIASLLITVTRSSADVGWYGDSPGHITLEREEHENIVLKNETVTIVLNSGGFKNRSVDVKGSFEFHNSGSDTYVMMAYPVDEDNFIIDGWREEYLTERGITKDQPVVYEVFSRAELETTEFRSGFDSGIKDYLDFAVSVDGAEPLVEFVFRHSLEGSSLTTKRYIRWPVKFAAGETKRVDIAFENPYERAGGFGASWYHYNFGYPLYTGGTWAGPIGNGTITVVYDEDNVGAPIFFESPGCPPAEVNVNGRETEIKWSFRDLEPPPNAVIKIVKGEPGHFLPPTKVPFCRGIGLKVDGEPAITLTEDIALKVEPAEDAADVEGVREFPLRTPFGVQSSRGEWWHVKLNDGTEGWLRWREVNPDTGEERLNAAFAYYLTE